MAGIKDVANLAGVSVSTVSNVINNRRYVTEEVRNKVLKAAEALNYQADMMARGLKSSRSMTLGVIITKFTRIFFPQVLSGMQSMSNDFGYSLMIHSSNDDIAEEKNCVKRLLSYRVDGIILDTVASSEDTVYFNYLSNLSTRHKKVPVIIIERDLSGYGLHSLFVDNHQGGRVLVEHLIEKNAKRIAFISGPGGSEMSQRRFNGYKEALESNNIPFDPSLVAHGDFSPMSGCTALKHLFAQGISFDGVFASNDQMAVGAIKCILLHGKKVPDDIMVAGFDNTFVASLIKPALTSIHVPKHRLGLHAVENLIKITESEEPDHKILRQELPLELVQRESTASGWETDWDLNYW